MIERLLSKKILRDLQLLIVHKIVLKLIKIRLVFGGIPRQFPLRSATLRFAPLRATCRELFFNTITAIYFHKELNTTKKRENILCL